MPKTRWTCLLASCVALGATSARADLTSLSYTPVPHLGDGSVWTANDDGSRGIVSYEWAYRCPSSSTWTSHPTNAKSITWIEGVPGNYEVRCTATFQATAYPPSQPPPQTLTTQISIAPPSSDAAMTGLDVPTSVYGGELWVEYWIYAAGLSCGGYLRGTPDERIRKPAQNYDSGWLLGPGAAFYVDHGKIRDRKTFNVGMDAQSQADWNAIPNGAVLDDFYHQNRLRLNDSCGTPQIYYFQEHHFQRIKVDSGRWKLIEL